MGTTFTTGVEKKNDAKRNYFYSNRWDVASDILETEYRLEKLSSYNRLKRKYEKQDENYDFKFGS